MPVLDFELCANCAKLTPVFGRTYPASFRSSALVLFLHPSFDHDLLNLSLPLPSHCVQVHDLEHAYRHSLVKIPLHQS